MENFPNINKVTGDVPVSNVEKQLITDREESREEMREFEVEPTVEEKQIIDEVIFGLKIMFEHIYKIDLPLIPADRIHIMKEGSLLKHGRGMAVTPAGDIYVEQLTGFHGSKIIFAKTLAHEFIHYLSFNSLKATEVESNPESWSESSEDEKKMIVKAHIAGLKIFTSDGKGNRKSYFNDIDEALTMYISHVFWAMEFNRIMKNKNDITGYSPECRAVSTIRTWLHELPDSSSVDRKKWDEYYVVSIPHAEEIAEVIKSDISTEEKILFYKEKIDPVSKRDLEDYYLERTWEFHDLAEEVTIMMKTETQNPKEVKEKTSLFIEELIHLKLTGKGFLDTVRFVEKRLGRGSFKKLAEKFSKVTPKKEFVKKDSEE